MNDAPKSNDPDATKLAAVLVEMRSLWAQVRQPGDTAQVLDEVARIQRRKMQEECSRLLATRFTWWQVLRSPLHTWLLNRERSRAEPGRMTRADWHGLNRLVVRIQFGLVIDATSAEHLRRFVNVGALSARDAWRLTHSLGCRVTKDGLQPAPVSRFAAAVGLMAAVLLCLIALLFGSQVVVGLAGECESKLCQIVGCGVMCGWLVSVVPLVVCCTWGRRDAARVLEAILAHDPIQASAAKSAIKRPLFARLAW